MFKVGDKFIFKENGIVYRITGFGRHHSAILSWGSGDGHYGINVLESLYTDKNWEYIPVSILPDDLFTI